MDQVKFFGGYVEWSATLPCPSTSIDPAVVLTTVDQAVSRCRRPSGGAVHINCMFREPLAPTEAAGRLRSVPGAGARVARRRPRLHPSRDRTGPPRLRSCWRRSRRWPARRPRMASWWPAVWRIQPHARSGVRSRRRTGLAAPSRCDLGAPVGQHIPGPPCPIMTFCSAPKSSCSRHPIEAVIHVGGRLDVETAAWTTWRPCGPSDYVVVDDYPDRQDPIHRATRRFRLPVVGVLRGPRGRWSGIAEGAGNPVETAAAGRTEGAGGLQWLASWQRASEHVGRRLEEILSEDQNLSEPKAAWLVSRHIGAGEGLYLASSMPVRDMDTFGCPSPEPAVVGANRGASGVDGTIATAAGFARGLGKCVTLMVGDVAFLHDLNSLRLCAVPRPPRSSSWC